jgi:drug/metabolite transporter (DMT)-like permease
LQEGSFKPYSEIITGSILYGTIGIFLDRVQDMSVGSVLFSRLFFGLLMIFIYLFFSKGLGQLRPGRNKKYLLLLGLLNAITGVCYFSSIRYSGISTAVLLLYTAPVYVNLLAPPILGEHNNSKSFLPLLLAIAGVLLISRPGEVLTGMDTSSNFGKGLIFGLLSGLSFGTTIITIRYLRHDYSGVAQTFWLTGVSLFFLLPSALSTSFHVFLENFNVLIAFGLTITFAAVIYLKGVSGIRAQTGSILALVEPVSGIFFDSTLLNNPLYISTLLGCVFILTAAYLVSRQELEESLRFPRTEKENILP